jgi:hypothetical protein
MRFAAMRAESFILAEENLPTRRAGFGEPLQAANDVCLLYDAANWPGLGMGRP